MPQEDRLLSINYLNLLSALEQQARGELKDPIKDGERGRVRNYGKALLNFLSRAFGQRDKELGHLSEALGIVASNTVAHCNHLLELVAADLLYGTDVEKPHVDIALGAFGN